MPVCKFFLQGNCRYGANCWNDHPRSQSGFDLRQKLSFTPADNHANSNPRGSYGNSRTYQGGGGYANQRFSKNQGHQNRFQPLADQDSSAQQGAQKTEFTPQEILQSMCQAMEEWTRSKMWPFSSFAFMKDMPSFPGFEDLSPEEVRLKAYEAEASGTGPHYKNWYDQLFNEYVTKRNHIMKPTIQMKVKLIEAIESIQKADKAKESTSSSHSLFGSTGSFGASATSAPKGFFSSASTSQQSSGSVFGGVSQPVDLSKGLISQPSTNQNTAGSAFGGGTGISQTVDQSKGLFGNLSSNQSTGSVFGSSSNQAVDQSKGLFGNAPAHHNSGSVFGGSGNNQSVDQSKGLFGNASNSSQQSAGLFGNQPTSSGLFGNTASQAGNQTTTPFGHQSSTGSAFGGSSQTGATSLGGFGYNTQSTGGATGLFGKTATPQTVQSGSSGFGQASVGSTLQPSAFTSQPVTTSASSQNQPKSITQTGGVQKTGLYTQLSDLTPEEKTAFEAPKFVLGKIPTRPPPRELV